MPALGTSELLRDSELPDTPLAVDVGATLNSAPGWFPSSNVARTPE